MIGRVLGPLGALQLLYDGREAFAQRDKQANPPRLSARDRQAAVRKAFDERDAMQQPEPDWMKSWGAVGGNAGSVIKQAWDAMQASNAAQAARTPAGASPPATATPEAVPLPTPRPQFGVPMPQPRPTNIPQAPSGIGQRPFRDLGPPIPRGFAPAAAATPLQPAPQEGASDFWTQLRSILAANGDAAIRQQPGSY